jgi:hypothetical protein
MCFAITVVLVRAAVGVWGGDRRLVVLVKKQSSADCCTARGRATFFLIADNLQLISVVHETFISLLPNL